MRPPAGLRETGLETVGGGLRCGFYTVPQPYDQADQALLTQPTRSDWISRGWSTGL